MFRLIFTLVLFAALAGQAPAQIITKPTFPKPAQVVATPGPRLPDAQILRNIQARLAKSKINADHFTVSVQNGIATFEGKTNVIQHKGVATRIAKSSGAIAVQNHIQISDAAKAKALASLQHNDGQPLAKATVVPASKP